MDRTELPQPNIPLLRKAVEWAEAEAAKTDGTCLWDQGWYAAETACGTAYCIAGYAVVTAFSNATIGEYGGLVIDGESDSWHGAGMEALGLDDQEAADLFADHNTIEDVRRAAEQIAARAGERL